MTPSDLPFLSIKEACDLTGRSESTVRRIIKAIVETPKHPDRDAVDPKPSFVESCKKKGEPFAWKIRQDILLREMKGALEKEKKTPSVEYGDILSILKRELDIKNEQIARQSQIIEGLNDRLREGNILLGSLQKHLSLPEAQVAPAPTIEATVKKVKEANLAKASKKASNADRAEDAAKASKKGFFARVFG